MASSLNSPNRTRPSTPASSNSRKSSHDHQKSFDQNPKVSKPQVSQPIYNNNDQPKVIVLTSGFTSGLVNYFSGAISFASIWANFSKSQN